MPTGPSRSHLVRRSAALLAAAGLAWGAAPAWASSASGTGNARASIDFGIVVPVVLRVSAVRQVHEVSVTAADVARGYVDVDDGTSFVLTSNNRSGFGLSITFDTRLLRSVVARIHGQDVESTEPGASLHVVADKLVHAPVSVAYRLFLAPGARPGVYRWPVGLAFASGA